MPIAHAPFLILVLTVFLSQTMPAQNTPAGQSAPLHPTFSAFRGVVYKIPIKRVKLGYGNDILRLPVVDTIHWDRIDFPDSDIEETPFPGVALTQGFGIIFTGTVEIPKTGWYQFATKSDDGSILWIDGKKIVDNDKDHRMRLRVDSAALRAGTYPVRLWYYQAYPTRYGVQLDGRYYRDLLPAEPQLQKDTLVLSHKQLLFAHNSSDLGPAAQPMLDSLSQRLRLQSVKRISITGHTDSSGTPAYNAQLSEARARAVREVLGRHFDPGRVEFTVSGKGDSMPVAPNDTEVGRAKNRRVVIEIFFL